MVLFGNSKCVRYVLYGWNCWNKVMRLTYKNVFTLHSFTPIVSDDHGFVGSESWHKYVANCRKYAHYTWFDGVSNYRGFIGELFHHAFLFINIFPKVFLLFLYEPGRGPRWWRYIYTVSSWIVAPPRISAPPRIVAPPRG